MNTRRGWSSIVVMVIAVMAQGCVAEAEAPEESVAAPPASPEPSLQISKDEAAMSGGSAPAPKDVHAPPQDAPLGKTDDLQISPGKDAWFRVRVPAHTIVRVAIEMNLAAGDLDLLAYDEDGNLLGSRFGATYPYTWRAQETNTEAYGFYAEDGGAVYDVRVVGYSGAGNTYSMRVDHFPYKDGASCTGSGFSSADCVGQAANGAGLLPFPFPDPADRVLGDAYDFASFSNYRFARRELVMLVRHALAETRRAFPGTKKLSLIDICQMDGTTPGYDVGDPRHPQSTHDQGGNIDISYFQTDGSNDAEIVCGDGAAHEDGYCTPGAAKTHIVDLPRQAFFMAQLFASPRTRVVGVDQVLAPLIKDAAEELAALPASDPRHISASALSSFSSQMAYGPGWPYHHHHIHLSMKWWSQNETSGATTLSLPWSAMQAPAVAVDSLDMAWPPRP